MPGYTAVEGSRKLDGLSDRLDVGNAPFVENELQKVLRLSNEIFVFFDQEGILKTCHDI